MNRNAGMTVARPLMAALAVLAMAHSAVYAQEVQPPRWTVALDVGTMLPAWLYNERVTAVMDTSFDTTYSERIHTAPLVQAILRYRPQSDFGGFFSIKHAMAGTEARYSGGRGGQQRIDRRVRIWTFAAGLSVRIGQWAHGAGGLEYVIAPVLTHHTLDLSNGHRDVFAYEFGAPLDTPLRWRSRSWTGWGFAVGASARFPVSQDLGLRVGVHNLVLPVATGQLASDEADEVRRLSGRQALFSYRSYTTHYPSVQVGLEYVLSRMPPRAAAIAALPPPSRPAEVSAETRAAREMAARGDTAAALDALRERVREAPDDASAWRDLALLLAADAEANPAARGQAWQVLQRAVSLNPDDEQVLVAYGRIRALLQRARTEAQAPAPPFTLSEIGVQADAAGGLSLALGANGLTPADDGRVRYRITVEVVDAAGARVPLRLADAPDSSPVTELDIERESDSPAVAERIELRLARVQPGPHTVRVRVTSLTTGQSIGRVAGFEIQ